MDKIHYKVIFTRRRSISIIVSPEKGVIVRAPNRTSIRSIEKYIDDKSAWIRKHLEKHSGLIRINSGKEYIDGEMHHYMGDVYCLKISKSEKPFVRQTDGTIEVGIANTDDKTGIKTSLSKWYLKMAEATFQKSFEDIVFMYRFHGFSPKEFKVRTLKSRWGSCTSTGKITLNSELIKLDLIYAEYVIIHELCHLKYHNHGKDFYKLLEELAPGYKTIRRELAKYVTR